MLTEHGVPVPGQDASDGERAKALMRAFGTGAISPGEFAVLFSSMLPPWQDQDTAQRTLNLGASPARPGGRRR
jgi:hypothetical protein